MWNNQNILPALHEQMVLTDEATEASRTMPRHQHVLHDLPNRNLQPAGRSHGSKVQQKLLQRTPRLLVVTPSGFRGAAKQELQQLACKLGVSYSGDLVQGSTTHLVCKRLIDCFGTPKYHRALEWGIHIVSLQWLADSAAAGRPLPEQDYQDDSCDTLQPSPAPAASPCLAGHWQQHQQQHVQQLQRQQQGHLQAQPAVSAPSAALSAAADSSPQQQEAAVRLQEPRSHAAAIIPAPCAVPVAAAETQASAFETGGSAGGGVSGPQQLQQGRAGPARGCCLLGSDSSGSGDSSDPEECLWQQQQQRQRQASAASAAFRAGDAADRGAASTTAAAPPAAAATAGAGVGGGSGSCSSRADGFAFAHWGLPADGQTSPCMQSFLPMLQRRRSTSRNGGGSSPFNASGTTPQPQEHQQEQQQLQGGGAQLLAGLLGSEIHPSEGILAPATSTAAGASAVPATAAAGSEPVLHLIIPETQAAYEDREPLCAARVQPGGGDGSGDGVVCGAVAGVACKTPDSLAFYTSKMRSRQHQQQHQQQQQQAGRGVTKAPPLQLSQQEADMQHQATPTAAAVVSAGNAVPGAAGTAPPEALATSATAAVEAEAGSVVDAVADCGGWPIAGRCSGDEGEELICGQARPTWHGSSSPTGVASPVCRAACSGQGAGATNSACTGKGAKRDSSEGPAGAMGSRSSSRSSAGGGGGSSSSFVVLRRLRRRDGVAVRRQAGGGGQVLVSDPVEPLTPVELAALEDSDCELPLDSAGEDESLDHQQQQGQEQEHQEQWQEYKERQEQEWEQGDAMTSGERDEDRCSTSNMSECDYDATEEPDDCRGDAGDVGDGRLARRNSHGSPAASSCCGSSLPAGSCRLADYTPATAHTAAAAAGDAEAGDDDAAAAAGMSSSQGHMPIKRLTFSQACPTCCSSAGPNSSCRGSNCRTPVLQQPVLQQQQRSLRAGLLAADAGAGGNTACSGSRSEGGMQDGDDYYGGGGFVQAAGGSISSRPRDDSSHQTRDTASRSQARQQQEPLLQHTAAAAAAVTHARRASPPSEGSLFVTRRRGANQLAAGGRGGCPVSPAASAAVDDDGGCPTVQQHSSHRQQPLQQTQQEEAGLAAEHLLRDLREQQQQSRQAPCKMVVPKLKKLVARQQQQKQQQSSPAEALLQDLARRQLHCQAGGSIGTNILTAAGTAADDCIESAHTQQQQQAGHLGVQHSTSAMHGAAAAAAAGMAAQVGQHRQRQSVSSSCAGTTCTGTTASSSGAFTKVPLQLQGGALLLQPGDSCSSSSSANCQDNRLEQLLQQTLAATATAAAGAGTGAAAGAGVGHAGDLSSIAEQQQQQRQLGGAGSSPACTAADSPDAVSWLHTPEEPGQQQQGQRLDLVGLSTVGVDARGAAMAQHLGARLAHLSQAAEGEVVPLKLLQKAPRGSTAKAFHGVKATSKLTYAESVQVPWAHATFTTKERSRCVIVAAGRTSAAHDKRQQPAGAAAPTSGSSGSSGVFLGEPVAFYKLSSGEWWVELQRFYAAKDLRAVAKAAGQPVHLPPDFQLSYELLRGMAHEHVPLRQVQGEFRLSKVRKAPSGSRSRANGPFFWRYSFDAATSQTLTDRPVTDLVVE